MKKLKPFLNEEQYQWAIECTNYVEKLDMLLDDPYSYPCSSRPYCKTKEDYIDFIKDYKNMINHDLEYLLQLLES